MAKAPPSKMQVSSFFIFFFSFLLSLLSSLFSPLFSLLFSLSSFLSLFSLPFSLSLFSFFSHYPFLNNQSKTEQFLKISQQYREIQSLKVEKWEKRKEEIQNLEGEEVPILELPYEMMIEIFQHLDIVKFLSFFLQDSFFSIFFSFFLFLNSRVSCK